MICILLWWLYLQEVQRNQQAQEDQPHHGHPAEEQNRWSAIARLREMPVMIFFLFLKNALCNECEIDDRNDRLRSMSLVQANIQRFNLSFDYIWISFWVIAGIPILVVKERFHIRQYFKNVLTGAPRVPGAPFGPEGPASPCRRESLSEKTKISQFEC